MSGGLAVEGRREREKGGEREKVQKGERPEQQWRSSLARFCRSY